LSDLSRNIKHVMRVLAFICEQSSHYNTKASAQNRQYYFISSSAISK